MIKEIETCSKIAETALAPKSGIHISSVYFGDKENALFKTFQHALGRAKNDIRFWNAKQDCASEHKMSSPAIALYRDFDKSPIEWKGEGTDGEATLVEWLNRVSMPHLFELTNIYAGRLFDSEETAVYYITEDKAQQSSKTSNFAQAADELKGKIFFTTTGITEMAGQKVAELMGLTKADLPMMVVLTPTTKGAMKYKYNGEAGQASKDAIVNFAKDFLANKIPVYHKSEPVPKEQGPAGSVVQVVRSTWQSIVQNAEHDVFVLFFNPEEEASREVIPALKELAEHTKDVSNFVVAQIDHTKNDVDAELVEMTPTLRLFPKGAQNKALHHEIDTPPHKHITAMQYWLKQNSVVYATAFPNETIDPKVLNSESEHEEKHDEAEEEDANEKSEL